MTFPPLTQPIKVGTQISESPEECRPSWPGCPFCIAVFWATSRSRTVTSCICAWKTTASHARTGWSAWRCCSWGTWPSEAAVPAGVRWPSASDSTRPDGPCCGYFLSGPATTSPRSSSSSSRNVATPRTLSNTRNEIPSAEAVLFWSTCACSDTMIAHNRRPCYDVSPITDRCWQEITGYEGEISVMSSSVKYCIWCTVSTVPRSTHDSKCIKFHLYSLGASALRHTRTEWHLKKYVHI